MLDKHEMRSGLVKYQIIGERSETVFPCQKMLHQFLAPSNLYIYIYIFYSIQKLKKRKIATHSTKDVLRDKEKKKMEQTHTSGD